MHDVRKITDGVYWVGGCDRRPKAFEGVYDIPRGVSYNSYFIDDEKTALMDTVDKTVSGVFFENLEYMLKGRALDYVFVHHMEPDHSAVLGEIVRRYPKVKIVTNEKVVAMIKQFFTIDIDSRAVLVNEGETFSTGTHTFAFVMAPMVHWPEVMLSYETTKKILFSADAFGTFGALNGNIFADEVNFAAEWLPDARRYYANIVGKYGDQVQMALSKAAGLDIAFVCPLHGPIWRKNFGWYLDKYQHWSTYTPEENAVLIAYASVYGHTENAVNILASELAERGVTNIAVYDVSQHATDVIVAEAFRCSHLVFASTTYNAGIFIRMDEALRDIEAHCLRNRTVAFIENGSWACSAGDLMRGIFSSLKDMRFIDGNVCITSAVKDKDRARLAALAETIAADIPKNAIAPHTAGAVDIPPFFKLSYGLFLLTARDGAKDNGCIINTAVQLTDTPKRITISVIRKNYTCDMIKKTGVFNVSVLKQDTPFSVFQRFGFKSGRDEEKFADCPQKTRSANGLIYAPLHANAYISGKVVQAIDYDTHTLFIADVTESAALSNEPSVTYQYYADNIKPKPPLNGPKKKGYVCKVCGYFHEGEELPPDFICPLCKHGVDVFEKVG
ncbi:MAG: flavin reductase [Spirochaetaceae bacterium]|jgi:flavorubredoxin/flavin reductase (DIM6/NTAB) family NADH-FMN oxidoreductase RutF/rubredoxin|nr:flavin reductase [Spirochaetaceae bacterium]